MSDFSRLTQHQLSLLPGADLVAYVRAANYAGDREAEREAAGVLAWSFEPTVRAWVRVKTPAQDVDDVVMEVLQSAIRATFDGTRLGEFGSFLRTIANRRVADYFEGGSRRIRADPLPDEHQGDDDQWGKSPSTDDETNAVALREAVERVLGRLNPIHRKVVRLYGAGVDGFEDLPADEVSARIAADGSGDEVTPDNVAKIASRFRADLRREIDG